MIDAHAHLSTVPAQGEGWVVPGVDAASEARTVELLHDPRVVAAVGLHPWYLSEDLDEGRDESTTWAGNEEAKHCNCVLFSLFFLFSFFS